MTDVANSRDFVSRPPLAIIEKWIPFTHFGAAGDLAQSRFCYAPLRIFIYISYARVAADTLYRDQAARYMYCTLFDLALRLITVHSPSSVSIGQIRNLDGYIHTA